MNTRSKMLMISVGLGILLNPLNSSMIAVAIARLQQVYQLDYTEVSWIIFAFYIASAVAQPVMGRASDMFGRRKIFLAGLVVAFFASMLAPLSPGFGWLIVLRIVQSVGTSMMISVGMAIVRIHIAERQAAALSVLSIFMSGASAVGPFIGGLLIHRWDWQAIFYVNLPFAAASFLLARKMIPLDAPASAAAGRRSFREWSGILDLSGIALFAGGLVALLTGILSAKSSGHFTLINVLLIVSGLVLTGVFARHELRTERPFLPLRTFAKYPAILSVNLQFMLVNLLFYTLFFGLPSYLQTVRQVSEYDTGILMLSLGLCSLLAAPVAGQWIERSGPKPALFVSALLMTAGSVWLITLNANAPVGSVCVALAAFGISNGLNSVGLQAALFQCSPKEIIGVASGVFNTSRYLGTILSSLLISLIMGNEFSTAGLQVLGMILTVISLFLVFMSRRRL
ncbi:MFS transporter ['Paenibacillus yunnanensis' Narsing Rao et al. 2020]|uniref:MFS transporter n=1 Tax=Paenibacillus tengchongensis TaxID=2608684 RepID=UPI00124E06BD|nr:MFS transporter [Paenibacillus tengchongensis]